MDYKFALKCWQDKEGSENAKINVYVDGTQVLSEVEVVSESDSTPSMITFDATGLPDTTPTAANSTDIRVELVNNLYVDSDNDRNVWISDLRYLQKHTDGQFKVVDADNNTNVTISDFSNFDDFNFFGVPTNVTGDQIPTDWNESSDSFYYIPVWGGDTGVTITVPLQGYLRDNFA
jgi:hypothetical protein